MDLSTQVEHTCQSWHVLWAGTLFLHLDLMVVMPVHISIALLLLFDRHMNFTVARAGHTRPYRRSPVRAVLCCALPMCSV